MDRLLLIPPLGFSLLLTVLALLAWSAKGLSAKGKPNAGKGEPYACGQNVSTGKIEPGYNFFPIAFFYTIMHVDALLLATVPAGAVWLAAPFLAVSALAVIILFRRD